MPGPTEAVSAGSHLLGAVVAVMAGVVLLRRARDREQAIALAIYVACAVIMLATSGVYHLAGRDHPHKALLQRLDHAAIWLQIAGTFTPVHITFFRGLWRWTPLVVVWTGAAAGVLLKLAFFSTVAESPGLALYLGLGWFGTFSVVQLVRERGWRMILPIFLGGVWYSTGALLELNRWPTLVEGVVGPHELFHLAVLAGVAHHWSFIHRWAGGAPPLTTAGDALLAPPIMTT